MACKGAREEEHKDIGGMFVCLNKWENLGGDEVSREWEWGRERLGNRAIVMRRLWGRYEEDMRENKIDGWKRVDGVGNSPQCSVGCLVNHHQRKSWQNEDISSTCENK